MNNVKMGTGGLVVRKEISPMNPDLRTLLDMTKKRERERAIAILSTLHAFDATALFPFVVHGPENLYEGLMHHGMESDMAVAAAIATELKLLEEQFA